MEYIKCKFNLQYTKYKVDNKIPKTPKILFFTGTWDILMSAKFWKPVKACPAGIYLFKINKKNTRLMRSITSFWCFYCQFWTDFKHSSRVSIVDLEQVHISWVQTWKLDYTFPPKLSSKPNTQQVTHHALS